MKLRGFAAGMLKVALRFAAPANREWGEGMLRELEHVEGEFAAFCWAMGCLSALYQPMRAPLRTAGDTRCRAKALRRETRRRNLAGNLACGLVAGGFASYFFVYPNWMMQTGSALMVLAAIYMMFQIAGARSGRIPAGEGEELMDYYGAELERQRRFHGSLLFWVRLIALFPGYLLFCWGFMVSHPELGWQIEWAAGAFVMFAALAVPLNYRLAGEYRRQLEELEAFRKKLG